MELVGYHLMDAEGNIIKSWGGIWGQVPGIPNPLILPDGLHIHAPKVKVDYGNYSLHEWWMEKPKETPPEKITRRQCAIELLERKIISPGEALAMTKNGDIPTAIRGVIEKRLGDIEARIRAEIDFAAGDYYRKNPLFEMMGLTSDELDEFFIAAARH